MKTIQLSLFLFLCFASHLAIAQVPILNYSVNSYGQVELEIEGSADEYYILTALHEPNLNTESVTSITMGVDGNMIISEPLQAYALQNYRIDAYPIADPGDIDGDGIDDITEFNNMPTDAPLNHAKAIAFEDGTTSIPDAETFESLSVIEDVPWAPFLNGQQFVKFGILDRDTDEPKVYFINSQTHFIHADFFDAIEAQVFGDDGSGEIVYNPNVILPNGSIGSYSFNFSFGDALPFEQTQRTFELLVANMPFLQNNMQHFIGNGGESTYLTQYQDDYDGSRINVTLESEVFSDIDFIPFHEAEGYGFFRQMDLNDNPGSRDIVLYNALPNSLPRVGGIMTSVIQTPLSHVNLRAIQDNVPNAYIKNPLEIDSIANLIGKYIYYKVEQDNYHVREATLDEVNEWYEKLRPTEAQIPERDLSFTSIMPLDDIEFEMSTAFGAKCSNVATMRDFGFPEGTIPDGFGIPFYYYDEFMKFNGFYEQVEEMISDADFIADLETRIDMLDDFRKEIRAADLPQWMLDSLQVMQESFPEGTSIRCRSSTNNEDLPGFSGAGLYTSKTQHPDEGHISKSVKQVYASMWNFRAFEERDFYRVDHYIAAMGILCHPNYQDEKSNGVGVSIDPIYQTPNTFYLNTQVGESLITNPDANTVPEEILLNQDPDEGYFVLRYSNLVGLNELIMNDDYLNQMREYLQVIHDEFEILYNVVGAEGFGMDIEYKVTKDDQLIIKQARPWVSFWADINATFDLGVEAFVAPMSSSNLGEEELVTVRITNEGLKNMKDFEISLFVEDQLVETLQISDELPPVSSGEYQFTVPQDFSVIGDYNISAVVAHPSDGYSKNDTLHGVVSNLHLLEGEIKVELVEVKCGQDIDVKANVTNLGASTFTKTEIEVAVNGVAVDTVAYSFSIPYLIEVGVDINITENLMLTDNEIVLNLLSVNEQQDAIGSNNSDMLLADLESDRENVRLIINADDYPQETSWEIYDDNTGEIIAAGSLLSTTVVAEEDICLDYSGCYTLHVYDSIGDGICCGFGIGDFLLQTSTGEVILTNNGDFGFEAVEPFCPSQVGCTMTASVSTTNASGEELADGTITIDAVNAENALEYSIDGGETFQADNVFENLLPGLYDIVVVEMETGCEFTISIVVDFEILDNVYEPTSDEIKMYPNPNNGNFSIEISPELIGVDGLHIDIYNNLGLKIKAHTITTANSGDRLDVSLEEFAPGTYIVRCYNPKFEKHYKVVSLR